MRTFFFSILALVIVATLAACGAHLAKTYRYTPHTLGETPATLTRSAVLSDGKKKTDVVRVTAVSVNGATLSEGRVIELSPGKVKIVVLVENLVRTKAKPVNVEFGFDAKAGDKYRFEVAGDEWNYTVMLKDAKGKTVLQKEFMKAAVVRSSILDL